ncbi:MAG: hypothetical protein B7Z60_00850 [Ferrovum sp. 37-45-19]|jgi:hypothetical protein|uniref:hypothetical protein n=1 Tax=Ferrovum sp. JA12 TaxID=1356299 RepID=UPI000702506C|nr:hypothetical protein [Ferrovum sp. JA12]OYV79903.1 MAG: hypothetical protein B7Z65_04140 [Ferrovum sp. 21-44-67]OYV95528.1 MAG: hypothetical protein B7Z60_00850 [Ferrovum sp. 37-45-19]OZB31570.1 MAG: hypothetical protein B7X47_10040 [Ferrovum sp. 34-44-207]HQT81913.1 hypothetical protein [Ferrovaceae bacterium]KRH78215.1 hypothetical protein FERRO_11960 [Ferrovum sp. JA12]
MRKKNVTQKSLGLIGVASLVSILSMNANAGATINFGDNQSVDIGLGIRTSFDSNNVPGVANSKSFNVDNLRLYTNFKFSDLIKATFNTEYNSSLNSISLLDAFVQFEPAQAYNLWLGRLLPAADRADMEGPFYITTWLYPGVSSVYKEQYLDGRDQGATFWGIVGNDRLTYAVGAYQGMGKNGAVGNQYQGGGGSSDFMFTGRLNYNFWDTKVDPAYFASSTYWGKHDVLAVGLAGMTQNNGTLSATSTANYSAYNIDVLMEKRISGGGAITLAGAAYKVDTSNTLANYSGCSPTGGGAVAGGCWGGPTYQGHSYVASIAYLFPAKLGYGKLQPYFQHQDFTPDAFDTGILAGQTVRTVQNELGINYVIKGYDAKLTAAYTNTVQAGSSASSGFILGTQFQF